MELTSSSDPRHKPCRYIRRKRKHHKNKILLKTDLHASKPKYNSKTEFGIKRNKSFIVLHAKEAVAGSGLQNLEAFLEEGAGEFYREIQDLASFNRNCVCAGSLVSHFQGGTRFPK